MRNPLLVFGFLFLSACTGSSEDNRTINVEPVEQVLAVQQAIEPIAPFRYYVQDGRVDYQYSGIQSGTETMFFVDRGMIEIKFTETYRENPFHGKQEEIDMITLMRDSNIYIVDRSTSNAKKMDNSLLYESALRSVNRDLNEVAEMMYKEQGGTVVGIDTLLGLPAKHWHIARTQTDEWRWKGILLKLQVALKGGDILVEATAIDTLSSVPLDTFTLPRSVNLTDGMSMEEWMEDLSKPMKTRQVFDKEGNLIE